MLKDGAATIGTSDLAGDAVTFAKIQNIATDRLIGRDTASTGDPEELTVGGGLEFTGSGGIQRSALTGDVTASAGSGSTTIANDAVTYAKMQNVSATNRFLGRITTGAGDVEELTAANAKTILALAKSDVGLGNVDNVAVLGKQAIPILAGGMMPATTNGCAALAQTETATSKVNFKTLDFDAAATEGAYFAIPWPKSADESTITYRAIWSHPATTTNFGVAWELAAVGLGDDDASDVAIGTAVIQTDTGGTTGDVYITAESSAVTISSLAEGDLVLFRVRRKHDDAGDTMAVDAKLIALVIFITTNAGNDA